jgi:hypothetical protein
MTGVGVVLQPSDDTFVCGGENMGPDEVEKMLEWLLAIGRAPCATVS